MKELDYQHLKELLSAHLQKEDKVDIYAPRVDNNLVNGKPVFNASWSWWGFFGGWAFFLYRKMYLMAGIFFVLSLLTAAIPFGGIILAIITGTTAFYFYTLKFHNDLQTVGYEHRDINAVKDDLRKLGGYNSWVVFIAIIFYAFMILFTIGGLFTVLIT